MRRWAIAAALAAAGGAVACSAPAEESPAPSAPSASVSVSATEAPSVGHGSLALCLSRHGMPAPAGPMADAPPGVDPADWEKAMAECSSLAPGPAG
ncbi:MAG: hypothetical protein ACPHCN_12575 [Mycobacterium sp.]